jgi:hypothetical protein
VKGIDLVITTGRIRMGDFLKKSMCSAVVEVRVKYGNFFWLYKYESGGKWDESWLKVLIQNR